MDKLFWLLAVFAIFCLLYLQTNRSIFARSSGLFLLMTTSALLYLDKGPATLPVVILCVVLGLLGFASDFYTATLRTWYFRVSDTALWGCIIGGFLGSFFSWITFQTYGGFIFGSFIGAFIGQIKHKGFQGFGPLMRSTLGAVTGLFGMSFKLLMGLEMSLWMTKFF